MPNSQILVVIVVAIVMGWFAFGILFNLRRGNALLRWMQAGLPLIGERTTFRWLGSSVAELVIQKALNPIRRQEVVVVLSPRDVPWLWLIALLRGRRDTLILRAHLSSSPRPDLELADPHSWTGRQALKEASERGWEKRDLTDGRFQGMQLMAPKGTLNLAEKTVEDLSPHLDVISGSYSRLSLRRSTPNLVLHIPFPDHRHPDSKDFFREYQSLARQVSGQKEN
jgi:hypothetical protein